MLIRVVDGGWSIPNEYYLRYRRCLTCGAASTTAEIPINHSFYRLDEQGRLYRREAYRRQHRSTKRAPWNQRPSDHLYVKVEIKPGQDV